MKQEFKILFEDDQVIVCVKPHGLATQSRRAGTPDLEHMLLNHVAAEQKGKGGSPYLAVIHRLDQPVAGILVFAKTQSAAKELNRQLTKEGFGKHYYALVDGVPTRERGELVDYLVKDGRANISRVCDPQTANAKKARLNYHVIEKRTDAEGRVQSLLEVVLDTGRHHQIRVQLAHMGCPIVGDTKYNPNAAEGKGWQTIGLCAYKLEFVHPKTKKKMKYEIGFL